MKDHIIRYRYKPNSTYLLSFSDSECHRRHHRMGGRAVREEAGAAPEGHLMVGQEDHRHPAVPAVRHAALYYKIRISC